MEPISQSNDLAERVVTLQQPLHRLRYRRAAEAADQKFGFVPRTLLGIAMKDALANGLRRWKARQTAIKRHDQIKSLS